MTVKMENSVRRAVAKALEVRPVVLSLDRQFHTVASASKPGSGYLVRVEEDGRTVCECHGAERGLYCYHRAAVGLRLGTIPERFLPQHESPTRETMLLRQAPKGRTALFA